MPEQGRPGSGHVPQKGSPRARVTVPGRLGLLWPPRAVCTEQHQRGISTPERGKPNPSAGASAPTQPGTLCIRQKNPIGYDSERILHGVCPLASPQRPSDYRGVGAGCSRSDGRFWRWHSGTAADTDLLSTSPAPNGAARGRGRAAEVCSPARAPPAPRHSRSGPARSSEPRVLRAAGEHTLTQTTALRKQTADLTHRLHCTVTPEKVPTLKLPTRLT